MRSSMRVRGAGLGGLLLVPGVALAQVTIQIDHYEVTAPTEAAARENARELTWSAGVFQDLFAQSPPPGRVILSDNPNGGGPPAMGGGDRWTLPWFAGNLPGMPAGAAAPMKALTHEAAHLQLTYLVNDGCTDGLKQAFNGYGSYLPDWVDESVAVYHEPDGQKKERRTQLKALLGKHIPLARYFTMDHPIGGKGAAGLPPGMQPPAGGGVGGGTLPPGALGGLEGEANTYYVESLSVIEYLCDRAGKPFFRFCVQRLQEGRSMDEVLAEWKEHRKDLKKLAKEAKKAARRRGRDEGAEGGGTTIVRVEGVEALAALCRLQPGEAVGPLPETVADLEKDWLRWVQGRYPGYDPGLPRFPQ